MKDYGDEYRDAEMEVNDGSPSNTNSDIQMKQQNPCDEFTPDE